jgi:hypothetical protein
MLEGPRYTPSQARVGASPTRGSGLQTLLFFVIIIVAVGAAGMIGVVVWGPEKTSANRTHLASNPPAADPLPSFSAVASADPPPAASEIPAPADSSAAPKKGKKGRGKKVR